MAYKTLIENAKKYLSDTAGNDAFEEYYKKATESINQNFLSSSGLLKKQYEKDKNAASAKSMLDSKNIDQTLAARGLSKSGESVQEKINSNVSLNNSLSALADSNTAALADIAKQKDGLINELDKSRLDYMQKSKSALDSQALELAKAENAKAEREEDIARETALIADEREYDKAQLRDKRDYESELRKIENDLAAHILAQKQAYEKQLIAEERAYNDSVRQSDREYEKSLISEERAYNDKKSSDTASYIPSSAPKEVAKSIVRTATDGDSYISDELQSAVVNKYVEGLEEKGVAKSYLDELEINLEAMGYSVPSAELKAVYPLIQSSEGIYKAALGSFYKEYVKDGLTDYTAQLYAEQAATEKRMEDMYNKAENRDSFNTACDILGIKPYKVSYFLKKKEEKSKDAATEASTSVSKVGVPVGSGNRTYTLY